MIIRSIACLLLVFSMTGCMGHNGLLGKSLKFNLSMTENRWGREGIFVVMFPVNVIFAVGDLFIFNSIEFWSGENPINGKSALVDLPMSEVKKMGMVEIVRAQVERVDEYTAKLHLDFENGDHATFDILRDGSSYTVSYRGVEYYQGRLNL